MQTQLNKTPRELARDYSAGVLSFEDYRSRRRQVIDRITGADDLGDDPTIPQPPPPRPPPEVEETVAPVESAAVAHKAIPLVPVALLVLCGVLAMGWLIFAGDKADKPAAEPGRGVNPSAVRVESPVTDPVRQRVQSFLEVDDWSTEALADFILAWGALNDEEQQDARAASWFQPLSDQLREQILEQRALGDINQEDRQTDREEILLSFAEHLGLTQLVTDLAQPAGTDRSASLPTAGKAPGGSLPPEQPHQVRPEHRTPRPDVVAEVKQETVRADREQSAQPAVAAVSTAPLSQNKPVTREPVQAPVTKPQTAPDTMPASVEKPAQVESEALAPVTRTVTPSGAAQDPCPASLAKTRRPFCSDAFPDGTQGPRLVVLPAGSFQMGSDRHASEKPVHSVQIKKPFAISAYEVSSGDYQRFCTASGRRCPAPHWEGAHAPRVSVSWEDARAYAGWLSSVTDATYRLPTEAEWEYAARAGTTTDYPFRDGDKVLPSDARFNADSPLPVNDRSVNSNGFRLRHMVGNVREWVADAWFANHDGAPVNGEARMGQAASSRVVRGGAYPDDAFQLRSSARAGIPATTRDRKTGFRIVRELGN